jgi:hypothetical protein
MDRLQYSVMMSLVTIYHNDMLISTYKNVEVHEFNYCICIQGSNCNWNYAYTNIRRWYYDKEELSLTIELINY